jgi:ketosteroid isomerase-like protein
MKTKTIADPLAAEQQFFSSLTSADVHTLDQILANDFLLIDVMSGSEVTKTSLMDVLRTGMLKFEVIDAREQRVRLYETTAVVTGRTQMNGQFHGERFTLNSRYTHVYVENHGRWQLVSAQGTQIAPD